MGGSAGDIAELSHTFSAAVGARQTVAVLLPVRLAADPPWAAGPFPFAAHDRVADAAARGSPGPSRRPRPSRRPARPYTVVFLAPGAALGAALSDGGPMGGELPSSADLLLRSRAAFLGHRPDSGPGDFYDGAAVGARAAHLDAILPRSAFSRYWATPRRGTWCRRWPYRSPARRC